MQSAAAACDKAIIYLQGVKPAGCLPLKLSRFNATHRNHAQFRKKVIRGKLTWRATAATWDIMYSVQKW